MLFKLMNAVDYTIVLKPSFKQEEVGPYGIYNHLFEQLGKNFQGFKVELQPFYNTDSDPRLKDNPEIKQLMEELLMKHPNYNKEFKVWDGKSEMVTVSREQLERLEKGVSADSDSVEITKLKDELAAAKMREGKWKKQLEESHK